MSPLPATIVLTVRPDFLPNVSAITRRIPLSCVVVVVKNDQFVGIGLSGSRDGTADQSEQDS